MFGDGRIHVVFQPHLYSRTRDQAEELGRALLAADQAIVTDVYGSRESPLPGVTGELVVAAARASGHRNVAYCADWAGARRAARRRGARGRRDPHAGRGRRLPPGAIAGRGGGMTRRRPLPAAVSAAAPAPAVGGGARRAPGRALPSHAGAAGGGLVLGERRRHLRARGGRDRGQPAHLAGLDRARSRARARLEPARPSARPRAPPARGEPLARPHRSAQGATPCAAGDGGGAGGGGGARDRGRALLPGRRRRRASRGSSRATPPASLVRVAAGATAIGISPALATSESSSVRHALAIEASLNQSSGPEWRLPVLWVEVVGDDDYRVYLGTLPFPILVRSQDVAPAHRPARGAATRDPRARADPRGGRPAIRESRDRAAGDREIAAAAAAAKRAAGDAATPRTPTPPTRNAVG